MKLMIFGKFWKNVLKKNVFFSDSDIRGRASFNERSADPLAPVKIDGMDLEQWLSRFPIVFIMEEGSYQNQF